MSELLFAYGVTGHAAQQLQTAIQTRNIALMASGSIALGHFLARPAVNLVRTPLRNTKREHAAEVLLKQQGFSLVSLRSEEPPVS